MRFVFSVAMILSVALLPGRAMAQWQEHIFVDLGVAMEFPAAPDMQDGEYQTVIIGDTPVPATILSTEVDNLLLKATVADLRASDLVVKGANLMGECYFIAELEGRVLTNLAHRAEDGTEYGVHGRIVDVEIEDEGRKQTGCFFTKGRLFKVEAMIAEGAPQEHLAIATRFVRSLRFDTGQVSQYGQ